MWKSTTASTAVPTTRLNVVAIATPVTPMSKPSTKRMSSPVLMTFMPTVTAIVILVIPWLRMMTAVTESTDCKKMKPPTIER